MLQTIACPSESDLLAFAAGDKPPPPLLSHLDVCPICRAAVVRLRTEIARLRSCRGPALEPAPPTRPEDV